MRALAILILAIVANVTYAQVAPSNDALPAAVSVNRNKDQQIQNGRSKNFSVGMKWNEASRHLSVPIDNSDDTPLKVLGVQSSTGLFITSFPSNVPAHGSKDLTVMFIEDRLQESDGGYLRLLTSKGIVNINIATDREKVVFFDTKRLVWARSELGVEKSFAIEVPTGVSVPIDLRPIQGVELKLTAVGSNKWTVSVKPTTALTRRAFPVFVEFSPILPGAQTVVACEISE